MIVCLALLIWISRFSIKKSLAFVAGPFFGRLLVGFEGHKFEREGRTMSVRVDGGIVIEEETAKDGVKEEGAGRKGEA